MKLPALLPVVVVTSLCATACGVPAEPTQDPSAEGTLYSELDSSDPLIGVWQFATDARWKQTINSGGSSQVTCMPAYPENYCWSVGQVAYRNLVKTGTNTYEGERYTGCDLIWVPLGITISGDEFTEYYWGQSYKWVRSTTSTCSL